MFLVGRYRCEDHTPEVYLGTAAPVTIGDHRVQGFYTCTEHPKYEHVHCQMRPWRVRMHVK